ncbi:MAG: YdcF family protein [Pseudomonadota bacterium]
MTLAIVLGAAVQPDGTASPTLRLRVAHAVALHRAGRVDRLIFTGGAGRYGPPEACVARDLAVAFGLPDDVLSVETVSRNTVENLTHARPLLPDGARVVLVTNRWHLPRALLAARLLGLRATGSGPRSTAPPLTTLRAVLREMMALPLTARRARRARRNEKTAPRPGGSGGGMRL